jgi:hypothetical protein
MLMRKGLLCTLVLLSSLFLSTICQAQSAPTISYTNPVNGPVGTSIKIVGNNFGSTQGASTVTFNGTTATPTSWSNTQIFAPVPSGATTGPIVVTVGGVASNHVNFVVGTPPTISYTNPVNGPVGTSITIVGNYFGSTQASNALTFNGTTATPTSWSNTQIVTPVPSGSTTGPIVVTVGGVASNHVNFTVGTPPTISYTNPVNGPVGTSITIVGNYFGSTQGNSTITLNGTPAAPTSWSNTQIVTPVPSGATTGPFIVTVGGVASNHMNFTVGTPPTISYTNPVNGPVGTSITIVGNYFGSTQGSSTLTFNGTIATPTSWSNAQIVTPVPSGATTGAIIVTAGGIASNHVNFTVGTPPTISYTNPIDGPVGTSINVFGNYFGTAQGSITFNGTAAAPTSWSNTQIVVPIPNGASTGPIVVTAGGMASNNVNFIVGTPPTISYTNPVRAAVGSSIAVVGNYFGSAQGNSTITFNGTPAAPTSWSNTQIIVSIPSGASTGPLVIAVGGMASNSVNFTVVPNIISLSPSSGPSGITVMIAGTTFGLTQGSSTVTFNGTAATPTSWSDLQITVPVPSGAGTGPVIVTAVGNASNSVNFTFLPTPTITSLSPNSGPVGASITISGSSFGPSQGSGSVTFNGIFAAPTSWSDTSIVVPIPAGAATGQVFVVTTSGISSNGASFTVISGPSIASLSPASGSTGSLVTINGTNFGATQGASTVTFDGAVATPATWSDTQIIASVPNSLIPGTTQVKLNAASGSSNSVPFTVLSSPPTIDLLSATTASPGQQVTIFGRSFGTAHGGGSIQLGNTSANVLTWTDRQIVATVATSAQSGVAQVFQGGLASNQIAFTIAVPDAITASASPAPNSDGWNNSNVTVSFTCTSAGQSIPNCLGSQTVTTEGVGQVVSGVIAGSGGSQLTASVTLNIDKTIPALTVTSPADGTSFSDTGVTVTGSVTDALSGVSAVACNGAPAALSGGSFSCNISLNVGVNLLVVRATDVAGNVAASIFHLSLAGTLPAPQSIQITPATVNMLVGNTQTFTAVDELGRPRTDATWTISDTTLATITTDSSPVLTAVAIGQPTLAANVQGASAQIQVTIFGGASFAPGTVIWSAPGIVCADIVQAVPTNAGTPDLYCVNGGFITAFTSDGRQLWQNSTFSGLSGAKPLPDAFGGLVILSNVPNNGGVILNDLDGQTGQVKWQSSSLQVTNNAIGQDGKIYIVGAGCGFFSCADPALVGIDGQTGAERIHFSLPAPSVSPPALSDTVIGPLAVDTDGSVNFEYLVHVLSGFGSVGNIGVAQLNDTISLYRVQPTGTASVQTLISYDFTVVCSFGCAGGTSPGRVIPDGQGGLVALWSAPTPSAFSPRSAGGAHVTSSGSTQYELPLDLLGVQNENLVLGENGTAFAVGLAPQAFGTGAPPIATILSYDTNSGSANWTMQLASGVSSMNAIAGGGVTITDSAANLIAIDATGSLGTPIPNVTSASPWSVGSTTWLGLLNGEPALFAGPSSELAPSPWPSSGGEPQQQHAVNPTATITVNFNGSKSSGDQLNFAGDDVCGNETLGLWYCPKSSWAFYVEGAASVSDDASKWKVKQDFLAKRSGYTKNAAGTLTFFKDTFDSRKFPGIEDPCVVNDSRPSCAGIVSVQQPPGQKTIFWLDHPGSLYQASADAVWDSLNETEQFTSKVCNRFGICAKVNWFINLVVDPGSNLDFAQSLDGLGPGPTPIH